MERRPSTQEELQAEIEEIYDVAEGGRRAGQLETA
jgi:hypothetical protein